MRDSQPLVLGLHLVGDAACTTNPLLGRGISFAAMSAANVVGAIADAPDDPAAQAIRIAVAVEQEIEPRFRENALNDRMIVQRFRADLAGESVPAPAARAAHRSGRNASARDGGTGPRGAGEDYRGGLTAFSAKSLFAVEPDQTPPAHSRDDIESRQSDGLRTLLAATATWVRRFATRARGDLVEDHQPLNRGYRLGQERRGRPGAAPELPGYLVSREGIEPSTY